MLASQQKISCPVPGCGGEIFFDTYQLLQGKQFVCPSCQAAIGLAPESRGVVQEGMEKYESLRHEMLTKKKASQ